MPSRDSPRLRVIDLNATHERAWRQLWREYALFYGEQIDEAVTKFTWLRIHEAASPIVGFAAEWDDELVGFAILVIHPATWSIADTAYLEDLYVRADVRGQGIGAMLIEAILERARQSHWSSIYWHTQANNLIARGLYDQFASVDDFVRYRTQTFCR